MIKIHQFLLINNKKIFTTATNRHIFTTIKTINKKNDQLLVYESYLHKHNTSLKKPHQKLRTQQKRIINSYLEEQKYNTIIHFLLKNSNKRLCSSETAQTIDKCLVENYKILTPQQKSLAATALVSFRQNLFFKNFRQQFQLKLKEEGIQKCNFQEIVAYLYGMIVNHKNGDFLKNIYSKQQSVSGSFFQKVYQMLFFNKQKSLLTIQAKLILQYFQLLKNPKLNKCEVNPSPALKKRSLLQIQVESFLNVNKQTFDVEMMVNNYTVDFLVTRQTQMKKNQIVLQVNGNYHYTLNGKLKGRQIMRNIIINQCLPLRIIHFQDFLLSKGHRNKLAYILDLIQDKNNVNWEAKNQGMDSKWQVIQPQNL